MHHFKSPFVLVENMHLFKLTRAVHRLKYLIVINAYRQHINMFSTFREKERNNYTNFIARILIKFMFSLLQSDFNI